MVLSAGMALGDVTASVSPPAAETSDACVTQPACVDAYLWALYLRAPKIDTVRVPEKQTVTIKRKGKSKTVTRTVMKPRSEDFAWKDPAAAEHAGMSLKDYVIGGMDPAFKLKLYRALRALDEAGLEPGITSAFRDDYRQSIAAGKKARSGDSFHGGSRRGGYGHGLAADVVSVKGDTRAERCASSITLWNWIDANGRQFGIGRPYLWRDAPHHAPIDGEEYAAHRGGGLTRHAALAPAKHQGKTTRHAAHKPGKHRTLALHRGRKTEKRTRTAHYAKARSG